MKYAYTSSDFRQEARNALSGQYWKAVAASLIAATLGAQSSAGGGFSFNFSSSEQNKINIPDEMKQTLLAILGVVLVIALIFSVTMFFIGSIISAGYAKFNIDLVNNENPSIVTLFKYFKHWKRLVYTNFLVFIKVFLWMLLFIIPGIIASYRYAMVPYILAENPNLQANEVLDLSSKMMKGNKWRLFCLQLSFIGWGLLALLTLGIGFIFLTPWQVASQACFYKEISEDYGDYLNREKVVEQDIFSEDDILAI